MSTPTAGNLDCVLLLEVKAMADQIWADDSRKADFIPDVESAKFVLSNQTANLEIIKNPSKDRELKVSWFGWCRSTEAEDCDADDCSIDGDEAGTECVDYALNNCIQSPGIKIAERDLRNKDLSVQQLLAQGLLEEMKIMDQKVADVIVAHIHANAGTNPFVAEFSQAGNTTTIPAASWTPDLFAYFRQVEKHAKLGNKLNLLSGSDALERNFWLASMNAADVDKASQIRKMSAFGNPVFDVFRIDAVNGDKYTYLVNPASLAFASKAYHAPYGAGGREIISGGNKMIWSTINSFNLFMGANNPVVYDLYVQEECLNGEVYHTLRLRLKYGVFQNPVGCTTSKTGILRFVCG